MCLRNKHCTVGWAVNRSLQKQALPKPGPPVDESLSALGWKDSNLRMAGPKPAALPLGDTLSNFFVIGWFAIR